MSAFCLSPSSSFSLSVLGLALSYKYTILKQNPKSSLNPRSFLSCILRHTFFFFFWPLLTQMSQKETFLFSASFTASVLSPWQQCLFSFFFLCCMSSVMSNSSVTHPPPLTVAHQAPLSMGFLRWHSVNVYQIYCFTLTILPERLLVKLLSECQIQWASEPLCIIFF